MCGICGFVASAGGISAETLQKMSDVIWRRGPDGSGSLHAAKVGLAMRRLAIIDLEGGQQPIYNEDRSVAVVFNGEIYNYKALRAGLLARGHTLRTHSDTEVLVHLYEEHGAELVNQLEGMFAFAIWDARRESLLLARDRLGIKPLFVADTTAGILFGSEMKSLLATGLVSTELDWRALDHFLTYTFIPAPRTIYRAIRKIPPGTVVTVNSDRSVQERTYWSVPDTASVQRSEEEWLERIESGLRAAVESHLVSDVPVGAFLSGGVDSGLMVALMAQAMDRPVETFTVGFAHAGASFLDERIYARQIAKRYRLNHHEIDVEPRLADIVPEIVAAFDEPFADDSVVPTYYVCQSAASHVKVAMTGLGGDEIFGGYRRHLGVKLGELYGRIPAWLRDGLVRPVVGRIPEPGGSNDFIDHLKRFARASAERPAERYQDSMATLPVSERLLLYSRSFQEAVDPQATAQAITRPFEAHANGTSLERALKTDLQCYLSDDVLTLTDRLSMWHSLELRVPYLDHRFVEDMMTLPPHLKISGMNQKHLLKKVAAKWLPAEVINHRKQGFEAPMGQWLRGPLRALMEETLNAASLAGEGIFDPAQVERLKREHLLGRRKHSKLLFCLLMFQLWKTHQAQLPQSSAHSQLRPMRSGTA